MNQAEDLFFTLPTSAVLIFAVVLDIKYDLSNNLARQRRGLHYPTYGPPTRKVAHSWFMFFELAYFDIFPILAFQM